jgi:hypothetical protein
MRKFLIPVAVLAASLLMPDLSNAFIDCVYLRTECINATYCPVCHAQSEQVFYCVDTGEYEYIVGGCCMCAWADV